jgi:hypothetical protein
MKMQRILKTVAVAAVAVSLSPVVASVSTFGTVAHANDSFERVYVSPKAFNFVSINKDLDNLTLIDDSTLNVRNSNHLDHLAISIAQQDNGRDIFAKFNTDFDGSIAARPELNVSATDLQITKEAATENGVQRWTLSASNLDLTGKSEVKFTIPSIVSGLAYDYVATINIRHIKTV